MNQFTRDIQIDLILGNNNPIIDTFNGIWNDLSVIEVNVYHTDGGEFIYYDKDNQWIFYQHKKDERFWCNYDKFWIIFKYKFNLIYDDVQAITKFFVEEALNEMVGIPISSTGNTNAKVGEALSKRLCD